MKKLKLVELYADQTPSAAIVNAKKQQIKSTLTTGGLPKAVKKNPAETEADLIKKWSEPEEDDIDPVGGVTGALKESIDLIYKYPWLLVFLSVPAAGPLWKIGKSSFKKMFRGKVDIASVEKQIFVASNKLQAAFKTGKFKRNMGYLSRGLLERELITPEQYKEFQAEIVILEN
jgi:hypothetical protein